MITYWSYYGISVIVAWIVIAVTVAFDTSVVDANDDKSFGEAAASFAAALFWPVVIPWVSVAGLIVFVRRKRKEYLKRRFETSINVKR